MHSLADDEDGAGLVRAMAIRNARRSRGIVTPPVDHPVEETCFDVAGWPLFEDEIAEVAAIIGRRPATLKRTPAHPLAMWRRLGGPQPRVTRSLDAFLLSGFFRSMGMRCVTNIDPAAWVSRADKHSPIYGCSYPSAGHGPRKGGARTACFIGEDPSDMEQIQERFVAQCIHDFCTPSTFARLAGIHGDESFKIADNGGYHDPRLPDYYDTCAIGCDLCGDEFAANGNDRVPTTWRRLLHRAEMFLTEWELVSVSGQDQFGVNWGDLEFWPLVDYQENNR